MDIKGTLAPFILKILDRGPNHGYAIVKEIRIKSDGLFDFKEGTLYPTLHGIEKKGLVESYHGVENGRKRRYYRLTERGEEALLQECKDWKRIAKAVTLILEGG